MAGIPIFVEVESTRANTDIAVCGKIIAAMLQKQEIPMGLAGTIEEINAVLTEADANELKPAIYVVNTFGAKAILPQLDTLMGDSPVLYLRRRLFAGQSGLLDQIGATANSVMDTVSMLRRMKHRLTAMCYYGGKNADEVAGWTAGAIFRFLNDNDFHHIERMAHSTELKPFRGTGGLGVRPIDRSGNE